MNATKFIRNVMLVRVSGLQFFARMAIKVVIPTTYVVQTRIIEANAPGEARSSNIQEVGSASGSNSKRSSHCTHPHEVTATFNYSSAPDKLKLV